MIRLAHLSDIHVISPRVRWALRDWFNKRMTGWFNLRVLRRGELFRDSAEVLAALVDDVYARRPDFLVFSGDATTLGFDEEYALAASLLRVGAPDSIPALAVPGNHDYYTRLCPTSGRFERYFAPWLEGERVGDATYPFARRVGPVYLIAVNSATANRWFWDSTGNVGPAQLDRLGQLLAQPHIAACPRILVTHYPIYVRGGSPEKRFRRLHDLEATLQVARAGGVCLWLHGHRHHPYQVPRSLRVPLPSVCAGSGTMRDCWTYAEYTLDGEQLHVDRRRYQPQWKTFSTAETVALKLAL
jgi:3',5'-cyclic AMP phosphodiesterase CpdA